MTGEDTFDHEYYDELLGCLYTLDPKLIESTNAQWSGFKEYANTGGNPGIDEWKGCDLRGVRSNINNDATSNILVGKSKMVL